MNIFDSALFKDYARPLLQQRATRSTQHCSSAGVMASIIYLLAPRPVFGFELCMISDATADSFKITIQYSIRGYGISPNSVGETRNDLTFNGFEFGKLTLPGARTNIFGVQIKKYEQRVTITDMATFQAFIRSLILNDETSFKLENEKCTTRAKGVACVCGDEIDVQVPAFGGPRMTLKNITSESDDSISATFHVVNPGSVELALGSCNFEIRNAMGEPIALLKGNLTITPGEFDLRLSGRARLGAKPSLKNRLVGVGVNEPSWCQDAVRQIDAVFDMEPRFVKIIQA